MYLDAHSYQHPLIGEVNIPGDKSISHRAVMMGALAEGETVINNFLAGQDCLATVHIMKQLGVLIEQKDNQLWVVQGAGLHGLSEPTNVLDAGNSGTTMRLMSGILAGQSFFSVINGDKSLRQRPMQRIIKPLQAMGAQIWGRQHNSYAPLVVRGGQPLIAQHHYPTIASAQVKSCLLLAGLYAQDVTIVTEPGLSRDHTERMLSLFGADLKREGKVIYIKGYPSLRGQHIQVPGDFSSAAFLIAAALITPGSKLLLNQIGINPTRTGLLKVVQAMGAQISYQDVSVQSGEEVADLEVNYSKLVATEVAAELIPTMIDEIPILAVLAAHASGTTVIHGVGELRHKETNRLAAIVKELQKVGVDVTVDKDSLFINGGFNHLPAQVEFDHYGDHRMAMSLAILGYSLPIVTYIGDADVVSVSFPAFWQCLTRVE